MSAIPEYHPSWSDESRHYFAEVLAAYGGWAAWNELESVSFKLKKFSGGLVFLKGLGRTFLKPDEISVNPKTRRVDFHFKDHTDIFENGKVTCNSKVIAEDGRTLFKKSTFEQWKPEHSTYFFGYAWANYISYPFILPQFELLNFQNNTQGVSIKIKFPANFHTHCAEQVFYFDEKRMLYRHDYHAPYAGPFVYGAHGTENFVKHQNIFFPCVRKVRPKLCSFVLPVYGIFGEIEFS